MKENKCEHRQLMAVTYNKKFTAKVCVKCWKMFEIKAIEKKLSRKTRYEIIKKDQGENFYTGHRSTLKVSKNTYSDVCPECGEDEKYKCSDCFDILEDCQKCEENKEKAK